MGFILVSLALAMSAPYWKPLVFAAMLAVVLEPLARRLNQQGFGRRALIFVMIVLTIGLFLMIAGSLLRETWSFGSEILKQTSSPEQLKIVLQEKFPFYDKARIFLSENLGIEIAVEAKNSLFQTLKTSSQWFLRQLSVFLGTMPAMALDTFIFVFALYYFVVDSKRMQSLLLNTPWMDKPNRRFILSAAKETIQSVFLSSTLVAVLQASTLTGAALLFKAGQPVLVFVVTFIFSFIPLLGTSPVGLFLALVSFTEGANGAGVGFLVTTFIAGSVDNVVRPFLVGSNLPPLLALISVVGGLWAFGILGLFLGPVVFDLTFKILRHWRTFEPE